MAVVTSTTAFVSPSVPSVSGRKRVLGSPEQGSFSTSLHVVADPPMKDDKQKKGGNNNDDAWIPSESGGFIPNLKSRLGLHKEKQSDKKSQTKPARVQEVVDIQQYKKEVADERKQIVCVRFYAPWCRSCKAIEAQFRRLPRDFPNIKFVECPVTKENAYLHEGLGVPSLPFGHIYHPEAGLVEEQKINKHVFSDFKKVLRTYAQGECPITFDEDGNCISRENREMR
eukprot:CAMPEP_0176024666 /NCGR_PEP_ID=MMETSP0120_2-20121206/12056_1 /TAXON_ID=160619 /ORGANISM="Kryptoperidinium foliaceum, Strain CCMP 1326" /LENGTH=226 /DNA_ID=CAMNT_0017357845 /DNA_START=221 /DNA_END=901 /DNA_ORIENTATION=+